MWFLKYRIQKTEETLAYWKGKEEGYRAFGKAYSYLGYLDYLEVQANIRKYECRLANLKGEK